MSVLKPCVLVTGVSSGIGYALVETLIAEGYHVFGSVRKQSDGDRLLQAFKENFSPLNFDVTDEVAIQESAKMVKALLKGRTLSGLINNAGVAWPAPLLYQSLEDFRKILDANLCGTFIVTKAFLPQLGADLTLKGSPGRVINITSVGGKYGAPFMGAYSASKHGVEGMSDSLRRELLPFGIDVIVIGPGAVKTPIWDKAQAADVSAYKDTVYAAPLTAFVSHMVKEGQESQHTPEFIARGVLNALTVRSPWTRYAIVNRRLINWTLPLTLPVRWVDKAMGDTFGLRLLPREDQAIVDCDPMQRYSEVQ